MADFPRYEHNLSKKRRYNDDSTYDYSLSQGRGHIGSQEVPLVSMTTLQTENWQVPAPYEAGNDCTGPFEISSECGIEQKSITLCSNSRQTHLPLQIIPTACGNSVTQQHLQFAQQFSQSSLDIGLGGSEALDFNYSNQGYNKILLNQQHMASDVTTSQFTPSSHGIPHIQGNSSYRQGHDEILVTPFENPHNSFSTMDTFTSDFMPSELERFVPFAQVQVGQQADTSSPRVDRLTIETERPQSPSAPGTDFVCFGMVCNPQLKHVRMELSFVGRRRCWQLWTFTFIRHVYVSNPI